jgi:Ca2+-binding RTX toxin-like protein
MTIARIGSEFLVNYITLGSQTDSELGVLSDGRLVASYSSYGTFGFDVSVSHIRATSFNAAGTFFYNDFMVNTTTENEQSESRIAVLNDGRYMIIWSDYSATGGDTSLYAVRARIFNADGTEAVPEFLINTTTANNQRESSIAVLADGRFVITWTDTSVSGGDVSDGAIRARIFNANGTQSVPEFLVNTTTLFQQYDSHVVALHDGRFVVTWTDDSQTGGDTSTSAVRARIFNANGTQSVPEFLVNSLVTGSQSDSQLAVLPDGRFIVSWTSGDTSLGGDTSPASIRARIFNPDGTEFKAEFLVNTTTQGGQYGSSIAVLADGRFVISWTDNSLSTDDASSTAIRARIFSAEGYPSTPEFLVNTTTSSWQFDSSIAALDDGTFVISWTDYSASGGDTYEGSLRAQSFDPTIYYGTAGSDLVSGGAFDDRYFGYGGNDNISGRDGDDYLNGGDGDDYLYGEFGNDRLDGGNGIDYVFGDAGVDYIYGRAGADTIFGGADGDHLWGGASADVHRGGDGIDYARYDDAYYGNLTIRLDAPNLNTGVAAGDAYTDIEGLVGGLGNDTVVGNASANFLFGGGGNDNIYGQVGADYLNGGAGTNNLWGGAGADQHFGGTGVDYARYDDANWGNLTLRLDAPAANVGAVAVGDTYTDIEGLVGGLGNDVVIGNARDNYLFGGGGNDYIDGRNGFDYLVGGAGADRFVFNLASSYENMDFIADFVHGTDDIVLSQAIFAGIGAVLEAHEFQIGMANAATDRIIYNNITGQLFYDSNGNGAGGMMQFASVSAGTVLDIGDFVMV